MHRSALILIIGPERDAAFLHNYLHTVNLSLGGRAQPKPRRRRAVSRMRSERRQFRCHLEELGFVDQGGEGNVTICVLLFTYFH